MTEQERAELEAAVHRAVIPFLVKYETHDLRAATKASSVASFVAGLCITWAKLAQSTRSERRPDNG